MSGLATEHLRETQFSLVNGGTNREANTLQGNGSCYISKVDNLETIVELENQSDSMD